MRGTPQQIIDKYIQLARDAQLSNDRVAAENFQQHGEHYIRLLGEAQREMDAKREQQEREQRERQQRQDDQKQRQDQQPQRREGSDNVQDPSTSDQPDVVDMRSDDQESGLVETPEQAKPKPKPRSRKPKAKPEEASDKSGSPEAAE